MKPTLRLLLILVLSCAFVGSAQTIGNHDANINWKTIENENVKIIFPRGTSAQARRIADVIEYIHNHKTISVGEKSKKIDLVLQNQQTISNGFVTLSPYRSEFFAISPQDQSSLGTPDWLDLLSVHEYRHALQYANANRGLTKIFHVIAGQNGWAASQGLSIPSWYLEGDAVLSETLLSENGRGRIPYFFKEQRALFLEGKIYSYHKAQNGSYKDIVPNIYPLGYMINNHVRNNYGIEKGSKILADAGKYKYGFYPFSSAMKAHTGLTTTKMYKESALALQEKWVSEAAQLDILETKKITKNNKTITHYTFPHYRKDGSIIAIKKSFQETPYIVQLDNGIEEKLTTIGISAQEYLASTENKLVWTEHQRDPRYANKNYSNIVTYDLTTKSKNTITTKQRYFSPSYNSNTKKIAAVKYSENISYQIDLIDAETGHVLETILNKESLFISTPKWTKDDKALIYLAKKQGKLAFFKYTFETKKTIQLSDWTNFTIGQYSVGDEKIYFSGAFSGIDNIYSIDTFGNKQLKKITSVKVGAYFPNITEDEQKIVFSEFTSNGYQLREQKTNTAKHFVFKNLDAFYNVKTTEIEHSILDSIPENSYDIKEYSSFFRGTKLHSWGLTTSTTSTNTLGANVQFKNILNDFNANVAVLRNLNENTNSLRANISYGRGLLNWNFNTATLDRNSTFGFNDIGFSTSFNEIFYGGGFSIPLSRYKGNYSQSLKLAFNYIQHSTSNYSLDDSINLDFGAFESSFTFSNIRRRALQNVAPRWGQYININYNKSNDESTAEKLYINSLFFFPGIVKNHSLNFALNWQKELLSNTYRYSDTFRYARGYSGIVNSEVVKISSNYELPLLYPDFGIWGITYFKRIRLNAFFDASVLQTNEYTIEGTEFDPIIVISPISLNQNSYGAELIFDNIYFNIAPIALGLRQSFLLNNNLSNPTKTNAFEVFLQLGF
ncbi:TolB family protein [Flavicella marina]|uniref:TolB family protein n=1 Tax=Flavicella marina TaxID=1475951 RepID=UPI0012653784|nr:hypothetical protein [Flavicella marina]